MNRTQLENLYQVNGLDDYQLRNTDDLLRVHGIDFKAVDGYQDLDDLNKRLYEKFIINYFNNFGLDTRLTMQPTGIYYVEETEYTVAKEDEDGKYSLVVGGLVEVIDKNGNKKVHRKWEDEDYKNHQKTKSQKGTYLRFEYMIHGDKEWMHVISEKNWY